MTYNKPNVRRIPVNWHYLLFVTRRGVIRLEESEGWLKGTRGSIATNLLSIFRTDFDQFWLFFPYFSYSFHPTWLKLYVNIGQVGRPIGCAQFEDSWIFGILVNLLSIFRTDFDQFWLFFPYFSYSFHLIFLKLYGNNSLGSPTMGCAQFADSAKFGILVNLLSIFRTKFGCFFPTSPAVFIRFSWNFMGTMT